MNVPESLGEAFCITALCREFPVILSFQMERYVSSAVGHERNEALAFPQRA